MEKFKINMQKLQTNLTIFRLNIDIYDKLFEKVIMILNMPSDIKKEIDNLNEILKTVDLVIVAISLIPEINNGAKIIEKIIKELINNITNIENGIQEVDNYIKPTRDKIIEIDNNIKTIVNKIDSYIKYLEQIEKIVESSSMDIFEEINPILDFLNINIENINNILNLITKEIEFIENKCNILKDVYNDINYVISKLNFIDNITKPLYNALKEKVTVPYSVNVKVKVPKTKKIKNWTSFWNFVWKEVTVWDWEWQAQVQNFTFTIEQIMRGINNIIDEVEKMLKNEAYKILNPIIKSINLNINIGIIKQINVVDFKKIDIKEIKKVEDNLNNILDGFDKINNIYNKLIDFENI